MLQCFKYMIIVVSSLNVKVKTDALLNMTFLAISGQRSGCHGLSAIKLSRLSMTPLICIILSVLALTRVAGRIKSARSAPPVIYADRRRRVISFKEEVVELVVRRTDCRNEALEIEIGF